ncbi:MAG: hypothetical protein RIC55_23075 [Pirellulaceae bacterium]
MSDSNDTAPKIDETKQAKTDDKTEESWSPFDEWWGKLLGAPLFWGIGYWLYYELGRLETEGGTVRINWFFALAYQLGGRWGAVGLCAVLGAVFLAWGLVHLASGTKKEA